MCSKCNLEKEKINHLQQGPGCLSGIVVMVTKYIKYSGSNNSLMGPSELYQAVVLKRLKDCFTLFGRGGCTWVFAEDSGFCLLAFFQISSGSNYSPHLTILSSFLYLGCQMISNGTYRSTESQRILDLALMCPIRQLMISMRAQLRLGKDKQSQSAKSWSSDWPKNIEMTEAFVPSLLLTHNWIYFTQKNDFKS